MSDHAKTTPRCLGHERIFFSGTILLSPFSTPSTTISSCHSATLYARHPEHEADAPEEEEEEEEEEEDDDLDEIEIDSGHPPGDEENF
ncbi:hypothetical protein FOFC_19117 [Fusarium oxysporum]|nr:hypothetical protein FOFC_19117 [Fusarium oxysporum]